MTGNSSNKHQEGQALLIIVMLLATALTVVLTVSFTTTTQTQTTKLEEESKKALAAAEAGIETRLKAASDIADLGTLNLGPNITGSVTAASISEPDFITPLLLQDEQYTFYLADYDTTTNTFSNYYSGNLTTIYFGSQGGSDCTTRNTPALELAFISSTNTVTRKIIEPCSTGKFLGTSSINTTSGSFSFKGENFTYKTVVSESINNTKVIIFRALFSGTKIGIQGSVDLKAQGKTITSEAKTPMASKTIQLFQSYPQIPAEFFVTSL